MGAPCTPLWVMLEREETMPVEYVVLKSAAFLMENGFLAGSGFFVFIEEDEYAFAYFVTAAHVVWRDRRKRNAKFPPDGEVSLKMNRLRGGGTKEISLKKSEWSFHED